MATKKKDEASGSASTKPSWVTNLENQKSGSASGSGSSGYRPLDSSGNDYASMVGMSDLDKAALDAAEAHTIRKVAAKAVIANPHPEVMRQIEISASKYNFNFLKEDTNNGSTGND